MTARVEVSLSQIITVHPTNPQPRLLNQAITSVREGGVIAYPTDSSYALGCHLGDRKALEKLVRIRRTGKAHNFTLVCRTIAEIGAYARLDNDAYRWVKPFVPGPYTFILRASAETPRRAQNDRRRTIGVRIPAHAVVAGLLEGLGEPIISTTLILPDEDEPLADADTIEERIGGQVDYIIDGGPCPAEPTTVIDLVTGTPSVLRVGRGPVGPFE
jgi:tRNA threonylcarbamoyl adenosine modification protein (Sua5/YciO/YrdC/YwlC family)